MSTTIVPPEKSQLTREEINRKQKEYIFPSVSTYYSDPLPMDHASMQHVWDVEGKKYLDFLRRHCDHQCRPLQSACDLAHQGADRSHAARVDLLPQCADG